MKFVILLISIFVLSSCYQNTTPYLDATVQDSDIRKYEIEIKYHIEGRGNIHSYSFSKWEYDRSVWIYVESLFGVIGAKDIELTHDRGKIERPYRQSNMRGTIEFKNGVMILALKMPRYSNDVGEGNVPTHWEPYQLNSTYNLQSTANKALQRTSR